MWLYQFAFPPTLRASELQLLHVFANLGVFIFVLTLSVGMIWYRFVLLHLFFHR